MNLGTINWQLVIAIIKFILEQLQKGLSEGQAILETATKFNLSTDMVEKIYRKFKA